MASGSIFFLFCSKLLMKKKILIECQFLYGKWLLIMMMMMIDDDDDDDD